jgi:hypothetical protein
LADAVDLSTPPITISCTAVLMSGSCQEPLRFHTFFSIPINHIFLGKRAGVDSILIGTLILQEQILSGCGVSDDITSGVGSDSPDRLDLETITVATTRIPVFGDDMQNPIYGYRSLCALLSVYVDTEFTSSPTANYQWQSILTMTTDYKEFRSHVGSLWSGSGNPFYCHFDPHTSLVT